MCMEYMYESFSAMKPISPPGRGGAVSGRAKKHPTTDTSTTMAEITEAYLASNTIAAFRNIQAEMGVPLNAPTTLFCDNSPTIAIVNGERTMSDTTRTMDLRGSSATSAIT